MGTKKTQDFDKKSVYNKFDLTKNWHAEYCL